MLPFPSFAAANAAAMVMEQSAPAQPGLHSQRPASRSHAPSTPQGGSHSLGGCSQIGPSQPESHAQDPAVQDPCPLQDGSVQAIATLQSAPAQPCWQTQVSGTASQSPWPLQQSETEQSAPVLPARQRQAPSTHCPLPEQEFGQKFWQSLPEYPV